MSRAERFEDLYRTHYRAVLRFARRRTDDATADDVVADTFMIAWRKLERVPDRSLPWLYTVASRELANRRRATQRDLAKTHGSARRAGRDPAEALGERDAILRAFNELPEGDREALRLVAWDGLSLADAARVAGTTRLAFAARVSRARRKLASRLSDDAPSPRALETSHER
jgi:RNA polymerase sigma factor (sigma-70 family)